MADEQTTQDEIISIALQLKTNFAKELLNANTQLNRFGDRASAVSKQAVGSLESLNRQLATTMKSMMEGTANEMQHFVSAISNQTGVLEGRNKAFAQRQIKYAQELKKEYDDVYTYLNRVSNTIANIARRKSGPLERDAATGKMKPRFSTEDVKNHIYLRDQLKGKVESFEALVKSANARLISDSINLIKQNVTNLTTASVRALEFVGRTSDDVLKKITQARIASQHMTDTPMLIKRAQSLTEAKEGRGALSSLYRDQAARLSVLGRSRREIEALAKTVPVSDEQTPAAVRIANDQLRQSYVDTIMLVRKLEEQTRASMTGMRPHIQAVNKAVKELNLEMIANGRRAGISLKQAVPGEGQIKGLYGNLMKSYGDMILSSTNTTDAAFVDATKNSRTLQTEIDKTIAKLKAQGREADRLKKTGFLPEDMYSSIKSNLADRLADVERFSAKVQQVQKDFRQLAMPKDFQKLTSMAGVDKATISMEAQQTRLASFGRVNMTNFPSAVATLNAAKKSQDELEAHIIKSQRNITAIANLESRARGLAETETDEMIKAKYTALADRMVAITVGMVNNINAANRKRIDLTPKFAEVKAVAHGVEARAQQTVPNVEDMKTRFNDIHKLYDDFTLFQQKTMKKWFVGEGTRSAANQMYNQIRGQVDAFKAELTRLVKIHNDLVQVQRAGQGTPLTSQLIANTKATIDGMRNSMLELSRVNDQAGKKMEMVQQKSITGSIKAGWDLLRNFRWQTAALGYFIYAGVNNVKRFVTGVFDEIADFRKQAFSLAAAFSYQMMGDLKSNYNDAVAYSRQLLVQMQVVAAKTSLSMEDMINLVRTFAQAGIIPKGTEDLEKIATIGTAIQAVTEGMANAGTQMKQELNALILGRQRATDSLAMMFQFMGVNIKDLMKKAKEEGVNMLDVFSKALKPFNEMMGKMKDEWGSVKNRIDIAWQALKRFALESFLQKTSKELTSFIAVYFDENLGQLTDKGKQVAAIITAIYEGAKANIIGWGYALWKVLDVANYIINAVYDIKITMFGWMDSSVKFEGEMRGILGVAQEIAQVMVLVHWTLKSCVALIKAPIIGAISLVKIASGAAQNAAQMHGSASMDEGALVEGADQINKAVNDLQKSGEEILSIPEGFLREWAEMSTIFNNIALSTQKTAGNIQDAKKTLDTIKLSIDVRTLGDSVKSLEKHFETKGISQDTIRSLSMQLGGYTESVSGQIKQVAKANAAVESAIEDASKQYGISADIIRAVAWKESRYNPNAVSIAGAQGIMQIMPETGKGLGLTDPFNMRENIMAGAKYLKQLYDKYHGDLKLTLAAYNAGPGRVDKAGGVPNIPETKEYVNDLAGETDRIVKTFGIDIEQLASKGPALFAEQAKNAREEYARIERDLMKGIAEITEMIDAADRGSINLSEDDRTLRSNQKAGFEQQMSMIKVYYALINAEEKSKTEKWIDAENKKMARANSAYTKLTQELAGKPISSQDKYNDWYADQVRKITEFEEVNGKTAEKTKALWAALAEGSKKYAAEVMKTTDQKYMEFFDKASSHKIKTPIESIRLEFTKLQDEFAKLAKVEEFTPTQIESMERLIGKHRTLEGVFEAERVKVERINQAFEMQLRNIDVLVKKNEYLALSYGPIEQEQAALNSLVLQHVRDVTEVNKAIADIDSKYRDLNGVWNEGEDIQHFKDMRASYEEAVKYMQMIYEREFFKKQHPMWNELVEQSKSWADGMTDALGQITEGTKKVGEAFTALQTTIVNDVKRALIKNFITNPMMSGLEKIGGGATSPSSSAEAKKAAEAVLTKVKDETAKKAAEVASKGGLEEMIKSGKPIPVYIVADPGAEAGKIAEEAAKAAETSTVEAAIDQTTESVKENTQNEISLFESLKTSLSNLGNSIMSVISGSGGGGGGGGIGGVFDWVGGLFGSGAGAGAGASGAAAGAGEAAAGSGIMDSIIASGMIYAFDNGGMIKEQVVGRGLESGKSYKFGEGGNELVAPMDKFSDIVKSNSSGQKITLHMPINVNAIDTQTGVDFLMKHNGTIENNLVKMVRNNRRIRDAFRAS